MITVIKVCEVYTLFGVNIVLFFCLSYYFCQLVLGFFRLAVSSWLHANTARN